jgi:hypothetical protein
MLNVTPLGSTRPVKFPAISPAPLRATVNSGPSCVMVAA